MSEDSVAQSITLIHWLSLHVFPNVPSFSPPRLSSRSEMLARSPAPHCCITYPPHLADERTAELSSRRAVSLFFTRKWASSTSARFLSLSARFFWPRLHGIKLLPPRIDVSRCKFVLFFTAYHPAPLVSADLPTCR